LNNLDFYKNAYKKYGVSARGLNWSSDESQRVRFEVITSLLKYELPRCSVVDAGCGFGDLYFYWLENGLHVKTF